MSCGNATHIWDIPRLLPRQRKRRGGPPQVVGQFKLIFYNCPVTQPRCGFVPPLLFTLRVEKTGNIREGIRCRHTAGARYPVGKADLRNGGKMTQVDAMRQLDPGLRRDDEREKHKTKDRKDEKG